MNEQPKKPSDNRTATQKITDLENAVMSLFHVNDNLARDVMTLKEAIKLLDNKLSSVVKASTNGEPLTDDVISRIMTQNNVDELEQRVRTMVERGNLIKEEQVSENSFLVGLELGDDDSIFNPRLQFVLRALSPNFQAKLLGGKAGDVFLLEEGKARFKLLESYSIQEQPAPQAAPTPTASEAGPVKEAAPVTP